jgi:hypothetical protein
VSIDKCSIFLSPDTRVEIIKQMCSALNIMTEANGRYLGLPANVGLNKIVCF